MIHWKNGDDLTVRMGSIAHVDSAGYQLVEPEAGPAEKVVEVFDAARLMLEKAMVPGPWVQEVHRGVG